MISSRKKMANSWSVMKLWLPRGSFQSKQVTFLTQPILSVPFSSPSSCLLVFIVYIISFVSLFLGGCPHAAIREDITANIVALERLTIKFHPQLLIVESGGDNLAANYSRELADCISTSFLSFFVFFFFFSFFYF